jgi:hypothetical protein
MNCKQVFPLLVFLLFSGGCTNRSNVSNQIDSDEFTGYNELENVKEVYYRFPSPEEMLSFISTEELSFNEEIILPIENANNYLNSKSQALNLGVYIADLAYITIFQRQKEALTYFQVVYGLSDKLRISSAFTPGMMKRFENNLGNIDSLKILADQSLTDITNHLVRQEQEKVLAIISMGGFIESLYLAFQMVEGFSEDNLIIQRISDQKLVLENIVNYALQYAEDKNVAETIKLITPLRAVYSELRVSTEETKVTRSEEGKLIVSGGEKIIISEAQFYELREVTFTVRKKITANLEN